MKYMCIALLLLLLVSCSERPKDHLEGYDVEGSAIRTETHRGMPIDKSVPSQSGDWVLRVNSFSKTYADSDQEWWLATVSVLDRHGKVVFKDEEDYPLWFPLRIRWEPDESLYLYSGDVGERVYVCEQDQWKKKLNQ